MQEVMRSDQPSEFRCSETLRTNVGEPSTDSSHIGFGGSLLGACLETAGAFGTVILVVPPLA